MYPNYYGCPYKQKKYNQAMNGYIPAEEQNDKSRQQAQPQPGSTTFEMAPGSPVMQDTDYTQGYLRTQIGKRVLVSFLIGTNTYQDRTGVLEKVGISYIILRETGNTQLLADIYSIKFVRIFPTTEET